MNGQQYSEVDNSYLQSFLAWEQQRLATLTRSDGYLTLTGLAWLKNGQNQIGALAENDAIFPAGLPDHIGTIDVQESGIFLSVADGVEVQVENTAVSHTQLLTDADPSGPTILQMGSVSWFIIKRGDALGIRIRDSQSKRLLNFVGLERFPHDEAWRIESTFVQHEPPKIVPIPTILGTLEDRVSPGKIHFLYQGNAFELTALKTRETNRFFLVIADKTSGQETYGGGRFITTEPLQKNGRIVIDFNKATNPPCTFSPFATCPRPPAENQLPFPIFAGEKVYHDPYEEL